jgi:phosphate transport system substrate-binding protein
VADGALDVAISARRLDPKEQAAGLVGIPYARTPFLFAVGPRTGMSGITDRELVRIYRGEVTTWPTGDRVRVVLRPWTDVDDAVLRAISPEMSVAVRSAHGREGMIVALTNQECDEVLARTPGAIGPTSLTQLLTEDLSVVPLAWNGVAPTLPNLASGAYPLGKTLIAVVRAPPSPHVRRFLAFLASPEAREILERTGNLPQPMPSPGQTDARRP